MTFKQDLTNEFIVSNPISQEAFEEAQGVLAAGNTRSILNSDPFPLLLKSGEGCSVTSLDGRRYLDCVSDFTAGLFGHSPPAVFEALEEIKTTGFALGGVVEKEYELGRMIQQRFPSMAKIRFCNSGTEASMYAVATALAFTQRSKILVFDHGYHGGTMCFPEGGNRLNLPHDFIVGEFDNIEAVRELLSCDLAAIIIEPFQYAGGTRAASKEFLSFLRDAANDLGAILIFDECVSSRLHWHGFQGAMDVKPDMTVLGKYMGGGFPFGTFGGREDIMSLFDPAVQGSENCLRHSGTFNGNLFTLTAAIATAKLVTPEAISRVNCLGERLRLAAQDIVQAAGFTNLSFSGYGGDIGIHFHGEDAADMRDCFFFFFLLRHRIIIGCRGVISLNFMHTEESVEQILHAISGFVEEYQLRCTRCKE